MWLWLDYWKTLALERSLYTTSHQFVMMSEEDRRYLKRLAPGASAAVVPNGVDCSYFVPSGDPVEALRLLFLGNMEFSPNQEAVAYFVRKVLPRILSSHPGVHLDIVGRATPEWIYRLAEGNRAVTVYGGVPDVRPYAARSHIMVVPLLSGSGTRLKILEALAMEKPVVSTSIGAEGLEVVDGEHLLIADTPEEFASRLARLFNDPELGRRLGAAGRQLVLKRYDWKVLAALQDAVYRQVVSPPIAGAS